MYTLRPYSRVTGNFVASPRSPELPKTRAFAKFFNKVGRQARVSVSLLREVYPDHQNTKFYRKSRVTTATIATELAEGRFGTWTGKIRGSERGYNYLTQTAK